MPNIEYVNPSRYQFDSTLISKSDKVWVDPSLAKYFSAKHIQDTKLKKYARDGIPDSMRGQIWPRLLKVNELPDYEKNFDLALKRTYGPHVPQDPVPPTFGGRLYRNKLALTPEGQQLCEHILCILLHDFPNLEYCPFLPPLCALICHHAVSADDALGMMVSLVKSSSGREGKDEKKKEEGERWSFFPVVRKDYTYMQRAFYHVLEKNGHKLYKFLSDLQSTDPEPLWMRWFTDFFIEVLPLPMVFRILDSYFIEGYKTLFRFAYALLKDFQSPILKCDDVPSVNAIFNERPNFHKLQKTAYNLALKKPDFSRINAGRKLNSVGALILSTEEMVESQYRYQRMNPKLKQTSAILNEEMWLAMWSWIPPKLRSTELELKFSTEKDGYHLSNMYDKIREHYPLILVIQTLDNAVFGAYIPQKLPLGHDEIGSFGGTGETFLFTLSPFAKAYYWVGMMPPVEDLNVNGEEGRVSEWEQEIRDKASFFVRTTKKDISIGGGGNDIGLFIDDSLTKGTSGTCATFDNQPLPGKGVNRFEIKSIEIFVFRQ